MSLVYAVDLTLVERNSGMSASIEAAAAIIAAWASVDPLVEGTQEGRRGPVDIEILGSGTASVWQLKLSHTDQLTKSLIWSVTVTILAADATVMATRLEHSRPDGSVLAVRAEPRPPGCIGKIIGAPDICAIDGGRPLSSDVWVVDPGGARALADLVLHPNRKLPIVAYTPRDEDVFDGGVLAEALPGLAHMVFVRSATSWSLQELIPKGFGIYGGAARIWWPHITQADGEELKWVHKLWAGDVPARRISEDCTDLIITAGLSAATIERRVEELQAERRRADLTRLQADVAASVRTQAATTFKEELDKLDALVNSYAADTQAAKERARQAESDMQYWKAEVTRLRMQVSGHPEVEEAAESDLLGAEIEDELNTRGIVDGARRRPFVLGAQFAATVQQHGDRYRRKIVRACVDVVLGSPELLRRIDDHALRSGDGGNDPPIRRADGGSAHRCSIEKNTPAARRVHYWVLPNGSLEFASVNVHDDASIPGD